MTRQLVVLALTVVVPVGVGQTQGIATDSPGQGAATEMEADIVATSIRRKGFSCAKVSHMERTELNKPAVRTIWKVRCDQGDYLIKYIGNLGYEVHPTD